MDNEKIYTEDIRLPEESFRFKGRDYILRCNMNVIADVQKWCNGEINKMLRLQNTGEAALHWLAAMMNEYADEQEWEEYEPYTPKALGREITLKELPSEKIFHLVTSALIIQSGKQDPSQTGSGESETESKN